MKTCIIIDDELNARESLQKTINRYFNDKLQVLYLADSIKSAVNAIKKMRPEIIFLDIEMPEENGLELFKYFEENTFHVIFTTAYDQYAIKAIKHAAVDYILKPVNQIDLLEALERIKKREKPNSETSYKIETLIHNLNLDSKEFTKISFPTSDGYHFEKIRNILYCKSEVNYTRVFTINKDSFLVSKTLKLIENQLPDDSFFRIHKSYLVNLNYVRSYRRINGYEIVMDTGDILPVSNRKSKHLIEFIKK